MNRVGLTVVAAVLACGGCSDGDGGAGGDGGDWAATRNLPTRVYGGATTGIPYSETAGAIRNALWVVAEDAPAGVSSLANRAQLELPEAAPPGVVGLWVVSQIAVQGGEWGDWEDVHTIFLPWGGAGWSSPVPTAPSRVAARGLLLLSAYASTDTANQSAATLLVEYGAWSGNGQTSVTLRGLENVPFPPGRVDAQDNSTGVPSGGLLARYRVVVRPASIGR